MADSNVFAALGQWGVLGVFAALLVAFARSAFARETERSDRMESEVFRLNLCIQERVIPALESATRAVEASQRIVADMQRERETYFRHRMRDTDTGEI